MTTAQPTKRTMSIGGRLIALPVAFRNPTKRIRVNQYLTMIGMEAADGEAWLARNLANGTLDGVVYQGAIYVPRPSWKQPPPEYVPLIFWAASRQVSKQWAHRLLQTGRLKPAWRFKVKRYQHALVWRDAEVEEITDRAA